MTGPLRHMASIPISTPPSDQLTTWQMRPRKQRVCLFAHWILHGKTELYAESKTLHDARCKAFEKALTIPDGPYHQLHATIFEELTEKLDELQERLIRSIKHILQEIQHEIDMACSRKDDNSKEAKIFRQEVIGQAKILRDVLNNTSRPCLVMAERMAKVQREQEKTNQRLPTA
jgi:hypothetical protein